MATKPIVEMLARNKRFAQTYQSPGNMKEMVTSLVRGIVVITCSDPRLNPHKILGIDQTLKATLILNAGGRALDAIRSLAVLQTINDPDTVIVMHHTDCGMAHWKDTDFKKALLKMAPDDEEKIQAASFGEILGDVEDSVRSDVAFLKASPWIKDSTDIIGLKYDLGSGLVSEVLEKRRCVNKD